MRRTEAHFRRLLLRRSADAITLLCPAKVNLLLRVVGRRPDGFHEIVTVMQAIDLWDELTVERTGSGVECVCSDVLLCGGGNLVCRAAERFLARVGSDGGVRFRLRKRIPVAAGLGGGSSDAASALLAMRRLFRCSLSSENLRCLAAEVGSDVPFFLTGGAAVCRGRGDVVEPWRGLKPFWVLLVMPEQGVSSGEVYAALKAPPLRAASDGVSVPARSKMRLETAAEWFRNDLEPAVLGIVPGLRELERDVEVLSGHRFLVSGSGPTLYTLCRDAAEGRRAVRRLRDRVTGRARLALVSSFG